MFGADALVYPTHAHAAASLPSLARGSAVSIGYEGGLPLPRTDGRQAFPTQIQPFSQFPSVAVQVLRPPVYSFGSGRGKTKFAPEPAPLIGSGAALQGVQVIVAETRHTTPQRVRDLVAAFSWAAKKIASRDGSAVDGPADGEPENAGSGGLDGA